MTQNDMPDEIYCGDVRRTGIGTHYICTDAADVGDVSYHHEDRYQELVEENERLRAFIEDDIFNSEDGDYDFIVWKAKQALNKGEDE